MILSQANSLQLLMLQQEMLSARGGGEFPKVAPSSFSCERGANTVTLARLISLFVFKNESRKPAPAGQVSDGAVKPVQMSYYSQTCIRDVSSLIPPTKDDHLTNTTRVAYKVQPEPRLMSLWRGHGMHCSSSSLKSPLSRNTATAGVSGHPGCPQP